MSVVPLRNGRPNESVTITATWRPVEAAIVARIRRALASESSGSRITVSGSAAFEWSTPAEAQTKPWRVSAITSPPRERTTRTVSDRITSSWRRLVSGPASSRARAEGSTSCEADHPSLRLRDGLLRDHDDVAVGQVCRRRDHRAQVVALADLRQPVDGQDRDHSAVRPAGDAGDRDPGVRAVAPVEVDDHRGQAFERAGARERPGVEGAPGDDLRDERERELLCRRVVAADERVLVGRALVEVRGGDRVEAGDDRALHDLLDPLGERERVGIGPDAAGAEARASPRPRAAASSRARSATARAVSSAPSALTASTARSTPRTASSFVAPVTPGPSSAPRPRARGLVARADHDLVAADRGEPRGERAAEAAGAAEDRDLHATAAGGVEHGVDEPAASLVVDS